MNNTILWILLIGGLCIFLYVVYRKNFKILKTPAVSLVTGAPKTGKSLLCTYLSTKDYKKRHRKWWFLTKIFKKKMEEPLYYTNVSISFGSLKRKKPHRLDKNIRLIKLEHLTREFRFNYKSVIYIQESSLMADNMDFNNLDRNVELSLYNKLIAHETRGGVLYYDTQNALDNHYSIKRVASTFFFIQKNLNLLLFHILYVREMISQDLGSNDFIDDVDTTTRKVLVPFWYHHKYDRYEFSYLTDDLPLDNSPVKRHAGLTSFNPRYMALGDKRKKENKK